MPLIFFKDVQKQRKICTFFFLFSCIHKIFCSYALVVKDVVMIVIVAHVTAVQTASL